MLGAASNREISALEGFQEVYDPFLGSSLAAGVGVSPGRHVGLR
jgi:hypothetical protein